MQKFNLLFTYYQDGQLQSGYREMLFPTTAQDQRHPQCQPSDRLLNLFWLAIQCGFGDHRNDGVEILLHNFPAKPSYNDLAGSLKQMIQDELSNRPQIQDNPDFQKVFQQTILLH